jgi:hypothetical protein
MAQTKHSPKLMPKRGTDADGRVFFDELVGVGVSRLKATGAIRLEDRQGIIAFGEPTKARRHRPYRFQKWRLVGLLSLPSVRPKGQKTLARGRCTTL